MKSKVLFFASDYQIGLSALLTDQIVALHQAEVPVMCICGDREQEPGLQDRLRRLGVPFIVVPGLDVHAQALKLVGVIAGLMQREGISVVHVQNNWQLLLVSLAKLRCIFSCGFSIVYTLHGFRHNSFVKSWVARLMIGGALFLFANRVICMSQYLADVFFFLRKKMVRIPLGVADAFFEKAELPSLTEQGLQIIYPAQFRHGKNQDMVIRAFCRYLSATGDTLSQLFLPGSGEELERMKQFARSLGVEERISFPGQCSKLEIVAMYRKCNVAVVASNRETFGQSIVEPFCMGRLVLSRPVGIAPDVIQSGVNGFIFEDENALFYILKSLVSVGNLDKIARASECAARVFSWKHVAEELKHLYISLSK